MFAVPEFVPPEASKLISAEKIDEIVTAAILAETSTADFADAYCDLEGYYCDDRMEVTSTCFCAWLDKMLAMGRPY